MSSTLGFTISSTTGGLILLSGSSIISTMSSSSSLPLSISSAKPINSLTLHSFWSKALVKASLINCA